MYSLSRETLSRDTRSSGSAWHAHDGIYFLTCRHGHAVSETDASERLRVLRVPLVVNVDDVLILLHDPQAIVKDIQSLERPYGRTI